MHVSEATFFLERRAPRAQHKFTVGATESNACGARLELLMAAGEGAYFGRANEGPGHWDEDENQPFGFIEVFVKGQVCENVNNN